MQQGKKYILIRDKKRKIYSILPYTKRHTKYVSVVVTTYNEERNIKKLLNALLKAIPKKYSYEIIIVDDNSPDDTGKIIASYARKDARIVSLIRVGYRGVLSAILDGVKIARGKYFLTMDADFSHPPEKAAEIIESINGYDMVVGSRYAKGGGIEAPIMHKVATISLNVVLRLLLSPKIPVHDFTGVFHALNREKFVKLNFKKQARWGEFDADIIYKAYRAGWKIKEVPFVYRYRTAGETKSGGLLKYGTVYFGRALRAKFVK